jgi:hypothetical protein
MPMPPYLISASLVLCEKVLIEQEGVPSAIRMIDIFYVSPVPPGVTLPPGMTEDNCMPLIQAYALLLLKAKTGHLEEHDLEFRLINTLGETSTVSVARGGFKSPIADATTGLTVNAQISIAVKKYGTCYLCVLLDGEEIIRTPFTLTRQSVAQAA